MQLQEVVQLLHQLLLQPSSGCAVSGYPDLPCGKPASMSRAPLPLSEVASRRNPRENALPRISVGSQTIANLL
jgi:hypothetical protein